MYARTIKLSNLALYNQFAIVLSLSLVIPFLIHLIPSPTTSPIGAYLIPLFFVPVIASFSFNKWMVSIASAVAPFVYSLINGLPTLEMSIILCAELFLFTHFLYMLRSISKLNFALPVISFLSSKAILALGIFIFGSTLYSNAFSNYLIGTTITALPGIILLVVLYSYLKKITNYS